MFVWLASYPKSGNTLVRSMLASYFFSSNGIYNYDLTKNILQFPSIALFEKIGIDVTNEREVIKNYIKVQNSFNKKNSVQFLKTHSYLFNIENNPFTDLNNSLGVIYIVRDPRNVVTSFANHKGISVEKAADDMIKNFKFGGNLNAKGSKRTLVYMGTWNGNYNSWKSFKEVGKYLLIKYEDLINDRELIFKKIIEFLYNLKGIKSKIDLKKIQNVIESTDFKLMQKLEKEKGFPEAKIHPETGQKIVFFNKGPKNDWKKNLDPRIKEKIENNFKREMLELGYL